MFLKNLIRCYIVKTINISADFLKNINLIEKDKVNLAKKIQESSFRSRNFSFLEKFFSRPYYFYKSPYKLKKILKKSADFIERHKKAHNFFLSAIQKGFIIGISVTLYLTFIWAVNSGNFFDEFVVKFKIFKQKLNFLSGFNQYD
jgi:hypothetical protein